MYLINSILSLKLRTPDVVDEIQGEGGGGQVAVAFTPSESLHSLLFSRATVVTGNRYRTHGIQQLLLRIQQRKDETPYGEVLQ